MIPTITQIAQSYKDRYLLFLRDIIAIPSVSGNEMQVISRIKKEMEDIGYDSVWIDQMGNCIGRIGNSNRILAFDGHVDTVDVGSKENWIIDPFMGEIKQNVLFGRGAADQKAGLASAIYAGCIIRTLGMASSVSCMVVCSVLGQSFEGVAWKHIIQECSIIPEAAVVTKPSTLSIKNGQRGRAQIHLKAKGISCNSSSPERGVNAIYRMVPIVQEIERLNTAFMKKSVISGGNCAVTDIRSSTPSFDSVPDEAIIIIDRRLAPDETLERALNQIKSLDTVQRALCEISVPEYRFKTYTGYSAEAASYFPGWVTPYSERIVAVAENAYKLLFNGNPDLTSYDLSTSGAAIRGVFNIPTIGFGPGKEEHSHAPYDQVNIDDCIKAMTFYAALFHCYSGTETQDS